MNHSSDYWCWLTKSMVSFLVVAHLLKFWPVMVVWWTNGYDGGSVLVDQSGGIGAFPGFLIPAAASTQPQAPPGKPELKSVQFFFSFSFEAAADILYSNILSWAGWVAQHLGWPPDGAACIGLQFDHQLLWPVSIQLASSSARVASVESQYIMTDGKISKS